MDLGLGFLCVCAGMSAFETGKLVGSGSGSGNGKGNGEGEGEGERE